MNGLIYLASAYSYAPDCAHDATTEVLGQLLRHGLLAWSPIANGHEAAKKQELPSSFSFWKDWCLRSLTKFDELWVYADPSGKWVTDSPGVQAEIQYMTSLGRPVRYVCWARQDRKGTGVESEELFVTARVQNVAIPGPPDEMKGRIDLCNFREGLALAAIGKARYPSVYHTKGLSPYASYRFFHELFHISTLAVPRGVEQ